jgi:hypothetical protein
MSIPCAAVIIVLYVLVVVQAVQNWRLRRTVREKAMNEKRLRNLVGEMQHECTCDGKLGCTPPQARKAQ